MPNPLVSQGVLNRLRASVVWGSYPSLNVTSSYLAKGGIKLNFQGESTKYLETMTGATVSPNVKLMFEAQINLIKAQSLADQYKKQMEYQSVLGDGMIRPDAQTLSPFQIVNCSIQNVRELDFSGETELYTVTIMGYYLINSFLFDLT